MRALRFVSFVPILLAGVTATAQNAIPHLSTYFGGADRDVAQIVRPGGGQS